MRTDVSYPTNMAPAQHLYQQAKYACENISGHIVIGSVEDIPVPAYARDYFSLLDYHYFSRRIFKAIWEFQQSRRPEGYREMVFGLMNKMSADNIIYYRNRQKLKGYPCRYDLLYTTGFLKHFPLGSEWAKKGARHMINPGMIRKKDGDITWQTHRMWRKGKIPKDVYRQKDPVVLQMQGLIGGSS